MYVPKIHRAKNEKDVLEYLRIHRFATLVSQHKGRIIATHIPMVLTHIDEQPFLLSHISVANEQKTSFDNEQELLAIFMTTHSYISSSWYDHINVPTWNYIAVHVYGKARIIEGDELEEALTELVDIYEDGRKDRFKISDMPDKMKKAHLKGLVGFQMSMDKIETAHKLSQNRNDKDYFNIIEELEKEEDPGSADVARAMKKLRS